VPAADAKERLLTARFVTVVAAGLFYFMSLGMLLPTVPKFIEGPLGGSELAVGVIVGSFSVGAVLVRPFAGRIGDRMGRRVLIIGGAFIVTVSVSTYLVAQNAGVLLGARIVGGLGEAAFFVGAASMITDLAPVARRGEAISYWSVAVYGGLAFGPALGELLLDGDHYDRVWITSATFAAIAGVIALFTRETADRSSADRVPAPLINRTALPPSIVLFLGTVGLAGFSAFMPLYASDIGLENSSKVFLLYGCTILALRIFGARIPDRIGPLRAGTLATVAVAVGLAIMAAVQNAAGLYVGTLVFSVGMSLMYPSMLTLALTGVPDHERGSAVGTISSAVDLSQGVGAAMLGVAVSIGGYPGAFATSAVLSGAGLLLLRGGVDRRANQPTDHDAAAAAREYLEPDPP
jgi:MFS family permease